MKKSLFLLIIPFTLLAACVPSEPVDDTPDMDASSSSALSSEAMSSESSVSSEADETASLPEGVWQYTSVGDANGEVYARGYVTTETVDEPFCETDCEQFTYAYFHVQETPNLSFENYLSENTGNSFVGEKVIGLGCVNDENRLSFTNNSDANGWQDVTLSAETTAEILNSSEDNPVALHLTSYTLSDGSGAPACYSHLAEVELYEEL